MAAHLAEAIDARLVGVHVLDRLVDEDPTAERVADHVLSDEVPHVGAEARGEVGDSRSAWPLSPATKRRR